MRKGGRRWEVATVVVSGGGGGGIVVVVDGVRQMVPLFIGVQI
jgi:hypothetical protein